jgi:hypothetical protein
MANQGGQTYCFVCKDDCYGFIATSGKCYKCPSGTVYQPATGCCKTKEPEPVIK